MNALEINKRIAKIEGLKFEVAEKPQGELLVKYIRVELVNPGNGNVMHYDFLPESQWGHGGPLIEKYKVSLDVIEGIDGWSAGTWKISVRDATPLKAAMLAIIKTHEKSKLP